MFIVLLSRCPLPGVDKPNSVEEIYLKRLDGALESKDSLGVNATIEEISGFVATLCQPIFRESLQLLGMSLKY